MKRFIILLFSLTVITAAANAMSYDEARSRAWYLTDKMAYELNLTEEQCNRAYEINLDYFLNIRTADDVYGTYWSYRNSDLAYVLFDWQYNLYETTNYFLRPLTWFSGMWRLSLYDRYDDGFYYFHHPIVYDVYRGRYGMHRPPMSPYRNMHFRQGEGMRDQYAGRGPMDMGRNQMMSDNNHGMNGIQRNSNGSLEWRNPGRNSGGNNYRDGNNNGGNDNSNFNGRNNQNGNMMSNSGGNSSRNINGMGITGNGSNYGNSNGTIRSFGSSESRQNDNDYQNPQSNNRRNIGTSTFGSRNSNTNSSSFINNGSSTRMNTRSSFFGTERKGRESSTMRTVSPSSSRQDAEMSSFSRGSSSSSRSFSSGPGNIRNSFSAPSTGSSRSSFSAPSTRSSFSAPSSGGSRNSFSAPSSRSSHSSSPSQGSGNSSTRSFGR